MTPVLFPPDVTAAPWRATLPGASFRPTSSRRGPAPFTLSWPSPPGARTLERDERELEGAVFDLDAGGSMLAKPAQVLFAVGGVDHHEKAFLAVVDDEVVDDAALRVEQQVVLRLAEAELRKVIGDEVLQELERVTRDPEPAHVGHVEEPGHVANGE